jgi:predicted nucleic acid-binding protein
MGKITTIGFDTMCLIYFLDGHPQYSEFCGKLFKAIYQEQYIGTTSIITKLELFSSTKLASNSVLKNQYSSFFLRNPNIQVIDVTNDLVEKVSSIQRNYLLKLPDAIQVATAVHSEAKYFISNDQQLKQVNEVKVLNITQLSNLLK